MVLKPDGFHKADLSSERRFKDNAESKIVVMNPQLVKMCGGESFVISNSDGVFVSDMRKLKAEKIINYRASALRRIEALACNINDDIWISFFGGGMAVYSRKGRLIKDFSPEETLGAETEAFIDLRFSPDGSPWYSDGKDLRRWDGARFVRAPLPAGEYVYGLDFASADQLWVARFGSLERYEWDGAALHLRERVTAQEGLPSVETRACS